ncbi:pyridoxal phosphate-dependent aminotransferase [Elizabethkingia anophelis]|uniref:Aminotransferase n=1 Tax=Elizabethkingia anophelis TaxID=1117645 RepID=A0A7Z7LU63_9FLAO|nr:histidinol-phosphate transaminase [Elizabethkingia anophelis]STC98309.1 Threonine-phosphate decarboxylase [Elizabethkingia anophelis]
MNLSNTENEFKDKLRILKNESGLHSASVNEIEFVLNTKIKIDACFLCNPYSQQLAYRWLGKDIKKQLQHYPPSNSFLAKHIGIWRNLDPSKIIVGNGAIELIYLLLNTIKQKKIVIPIPTFSTYYELLEKDNQILYFQLSADNEYRIDIYSFIEFIERENPDYVILINPSNPSGQILYPDDIKLIHSLLKTNQVLIIDESFIDFADLDASIEYCADNQENIVIIRSLSKDFGLAGLRLGYSLMPHRIKEQLNGSSFLWNINGLASIFCTYLSNEKFILEYNKCRLRYIEDKKAFYGQLCELPVKVYDSSANFFLIKPEVLAEDLFVRLLYKYGIYSRLLNDKIGLDKNYLRIASKTEIENKKIINALDKELS